MATPEELSAIWSTAVSQFPDLAEKWGQQLPKEKSQQLAALKQYSDYLKPGASRIVEQRRFRPDVHEMVTPIDPSTVQPPTYFTGDYWKDIGKKVGTGLSDIMLTGSNLYPLTEGSKRVKELQETLPEGEKLGAFQRFLTGISPTLEGFEGIQRIAAPAAGYVMAQPGLQEPGVQKRVDILKERGGAPGFLGDIERHASAYQQAVEAGEIPLKKQIPVEAGTDPFELLPGGIALGVGRKALGLGGGVLGAKVFAPTAPTIARTTASQVPAPPTNVGAVQRALPLEDISPEFGGDIMATQPQQQLLFPSTAIPDIPAEELARRQTIGDVDPDVVQRMRQADPRTLEEEVIPTPSKVGPWFQPDLSVPEAVAGLTKRELARLTELRASKARLDATPSNKWNDKLFASRRKIVDQIAALEAKQAAAQTDTQLVERIPIAKEIQDFTGRVSERITPDMQTNIDHLLDYKQAGVDLTNPESVAFIHTGKMSGRIARLTGELSEKLFGNRHPSNMAKVTAYIDSLTPIQPSLLEDYGTLKMNLQGDDGNGIWQKWLQDYYTFDESSGTYIRKTGKPLDPTQKGWKGTEAESATSQHIDNIAPGPGDPVTSGSTSAWVDDVPLITDLIYDEARRSIKDAAAPEELSSYEGILGWFKRPKSALYKTALRRFEGNARRHDAMMSDVIANGTEELNELGWFDAKGIPTIEALGSWDVPGPLRLLFNALHDESLLPQLQMVGGEKAVRQYHNLRKLTKWEENLRRNDDAFRLIEFDLGSPEQYFFRGVIPEDGMTVTQFHNNLTKLGRTKSIEMSRVSKSWVELQELGLRPIYWNPYEQAMVSSRIGLQQRMQVQLLELLKTPELDMAKLVIRGQGEYADLVEKGWKEVTNAGPALKGDTFRGVSRKFDQLDENGIPLIPKEAAEKHATTLSHTWMFPGPVANSLQEMFAPRSKFVQWMRLETPEFMGRQWKADDLFFIPKRAQLMASLFQQIDFAGRAGGTGFGTALHRLHLGMGHLGKGQVDEGFTDLVGAFNHTARILPHWYKMGKGFFSKDYQSELKRMRNDKTPWFPNDPDPDSAEYNWSNLFWNGLHDTDITVFDSEEGIKILSSVVDELGIAQKVAHGASAPVRYTGRAVAMVEEYMRTGLFNGVYPAAIMYDVRYNLVPLFRRIHPDLNPDQIMAMAVLKANIKWSTIPAEQSVVKGWTKDILKRLLFSVSENEAFARQATGMIPARLRPGTMLEGAPKGTTDAPFWIYQNIGALTFFGVVGNLIHFMTTTDLKRDEDGAVTGVDWGEALPAKRYMPYVHHGWSKLGYGYNPEFLSPNIPFLTRSGDQAMLDLLGQYDFLFRMLDGGYGLPFVSGINSRLGTFPRTVLSQSIERDFRGRDIAKWGYLQKALQGVYDLFGPIGAGQLSVGLVQAKWGDKAMPSATSRLGTLIAPGATLSDILPAHETRIGGGAQVVQALGWNVKAPTNEAIKNKMVKKLFGRGDFPGYEDTVIKTWKEFQAHPEYQILLPRLMNHADNLIEVEELNLRQSEGFEDHYDGTGKMLYEMNQSRKEQNRDHVETSKKYAYMLYDTRPWTALDKVAWDPTVFKKAMKQDNRAHIERIQQLQKTYGHDPFVLMSIEEWKEQPDRASAPLEWAIWQFHKTMEESKDERGEISWDVFNETWDKEMAGWDDLERMETGGLQDLFERWQLERIKYPDPNQHHLISEYKDSIDYLQKKNYWQDGPRIDYEKSDIASGAIIYVEDNFLTQMNSLQRIHGEDLGTGGESAWSVWSKYLASSPKERTRMRSAGRWSVRRTIDVMESARASHRYNIAIADDRIDKILIRWFGNTPYRISNKPYFHRHYGKEPGSVRKLPR